MPTVQQAYEMLKFWKDSGKGDLHVNHLVLIEREAEKKAKNEPDETGKRKTRIAWDCGDPDTFAAFHKERERFMQAAHSNPTLATDALICALRLHDDEEIRNFVDAVQKATAQAGGKW
jgi:hypothetical protein